MRQLAKVVTMLVLVALLAAPVVAQEKQKKGKRGQQRGAASGMLNKLEKANLTDEQKEKIKKVVAKYEPKMKELAGALKQTPEQREAAMAARKKAAAEGKKGKELRDAVDAAMNLTDEQKELRKKQQTLQQEMQKEVFALLTPEQLKIVQPVGKKRDGADKAKRKGGKRNKSDK